MNTLAALALIFAQMSLLAFGGGNSVLPEMQRQVVQVQGWMPAREFAALFALAQAAPGPNMLFVALIGMQVYGLPGALVAIGSLCAPSSVLTYFAAGWWHRFRDAGWRQVVQHGLAPVTAGLVMASAVLLTETTSISWRHAAVTSVASAVFLLTRLHPLIVLGVAAALGALGMV